MEVSNLSHLPLVKQPEVGGDRSAVTACTAHGSQHRLTTQTPGLSFALGHKWRLFWASPKSHSELLPADIGSWSCSIKWGVRNRAGGTFPPCAKQTFLRGNLKLKAYYSLLREPPQLKQSINASYELQNFPSGDMAWALPWKHWSQGSVPGKERVLLSKVIKMEKCRVWTRLRPCKTSSCMHKHLVCAGKYGLNMHSQAQWSNFTVSMYVLTSENLSSNIL